MNKIINVACNIDSKYTQYCGVLLVSLFENNKDLLIKVHVLGFKLTIEDKKGLEKIANNYNNEVHFYELDESYFANFPVTEQWPIVIYFRLLLPELIDKSVERLLYFDCDIVLRGSILELFEMNMKGNIIGAVEDVLSPYAPIIEELEYNPELYYFNSGVILIDIPKWKENNITYKCIEYIKNHKVTHPDQDALNAVLCGRWLRLHYRWNYLSNFHTTYTKEEYFQSDINCKGQYFPIVIHFTGLKPWNSKCRDPFKFEYFSYLKRTQWSGSIPKHSLSEWIWYFGSICFDKLGIKKMNKYYRF